MRQERLSQTAGRVLHEVMARGAATRPEISAALGVTKQTVSAAVVELEQRQLIEALTMRQGHTGRAAAQYGLAPDGGWIAGVDLGSARLRVAAATIDGRILADRLVPNPAPTVDRRWPDQLTSAAAALTDIAATMSYSSGGLLGIGLAVPTAIAERRDLIGERWEQADQQLMAALEAVAPAAAWAENDVNCEALAQLRYRPDSRARSVVHLHVGVGVGAALIVNGVLVRGAHGRAGEIAGLAQAGTDAAPSVTLERSLGAAGLLASAGHSVKANMPAALDDLFSAATLGDAAAESALAAEARGIAALLIQLCAFIDPELVVLSGQVGGRRELHTQVSTELARLGAAVDLAEDPLGDASAVLGAVAMASEQVVTALTGVTISPPPHD